jgi:multidrug transporter EmrE-like cation transporter
MLRAILAWAGVLEEHTTWLIPFAFLLGNLAFNVLANASFKLSAQGGWRAFLEWQLIGNLAGFVTVLCLTGMLKFIPLHIAFPVTSGLSVLGVQLFAAAWYFHEPIGRGQWVGAILVAVGILFIGL